MLALEWAYRRPPSLTLLLFLVFGSLRSLTLPSVEGGHSLRSFPTLASLEDFKVFSHFVRGDSPFVRGKKVKKDKIIK